MEQSRVTLTNYEHMSAAVYSMRDDLAALTYPVNQLQKVALIDNKLQEIAALLLDVRAIEKRFQENEAYEAAPMRTNL